MGKTLEQLITIWKKLGINQKVTVFFLLVAFIAGAAALVHLSSRPSYELLYADLGEGDMAQVASFLKESNVPFRITNGGKSIMVAEGTKYDMRMGLANKGMMPGSGKGLAMFEKASWGTSQMAEQMIKRRAIQEELARTIVRLEQVEWADVQIAQTEPTLFDEDKKPTDSWPPPREVIIRFPSDLQVELVGDPPRVQFKLVKIAPPDVAPPPP